MARSLLNPMSQDTGLYFAQFPRNFDRLQAVSLSVRDGHDHGGSISSEIHQFYREIIFTEPEILIAPQPDEYQDSDPAIIIAESHILESSHLQNTLERFDLQTTAYISVTRNLFLHCFEFVVKHRLAPFWNKIGPYYIKGRDFLQEKGKMCSIQACFSLTNKITLALKAQMLKLPPQQIDEFGVSPNIMQKFQCSNSFSIDGCSLENNTCIVFPSLKTGYITCIAHRNTVKDFDFKRYWKVMYGFRVPESPQDVIYSVRFCAGGKTFLYPEHCIRSNQPHVFLRCDQKAIFSSFIEDLSSRLPSICGSPLKFTSTTLYPTTLFSSASFSKQTNLTRSTKSSNACKMFVFTGDKDEILAKTAEKPNATPNKPWQRETSSVHVTPCNDKPYVPCFKKTKFSGNLSKKAILQENDQRSVKKVKPITPCFKTKFARANQQKTRLETERIVRSTTTKSHIPARQNERPSGLLISSPKQNVNNNGTAVHPTEDYLPSINCQQTESIPVAIQNHPMEQHVFVERKYSDVAGSEVNKNRNKSTKAEMNIDIRKLAMENKVFRRCSQWDVFWRGHRTWFYPRVLDVALPQLTDEQLFFKRTSNDGPLRVNAVAILKWLKSEGVQCKSKEKKADLLLKVYGYLGVKQAEQR